MCERIRDREREKERKKRMKAACIILSLLIYAFGIS